MDKIGSPLTYSAPRAKPADQASTLDAKTLKQIGDAAESFEANFMAQMLGFMWTDVDTGGMFGGGQAEEIWRGMLIEEYGNITAKAGGVGVADMVKAEMIRLQEAHQKNLQNPSTIKGDS